MRYLRKDFRMIADPRIWKELWRPLNDSLEDIMNQTQANRYSKHFFGQHHLKALVLFQMTEGQSLEDLHQLLTEDLRFKVFTHSPYVSKSQLSRANAKRPIQAFQRMFLSLVDQLPAKVKIPRSLKELSQRIRVFDGTCLALNPNYCPWAVYRHQFREPDAGIRMTLRLHLGSPAPDRVFVHPFQDYSACYFKSSLDLDQRGFLYLFDREFNNHQTFEQISLSKNFFLTRMKETNTYQVLETRSNSTRFRHGLKILKDQTIRLGKKHNLTTLFRRIEAVDQDQNSIVFLTNLFAFSATTVAQLYRRRWEIESFFKWIKQHLKIKRFIAYSLNGILLQIYAALILFLLLVLFRYANRLKISLFDLFRKFRSRMCVITPVFVIRSQKLKLLNLWNPLYFQASPLGVPF